MNELEQEYLEMLEKQEAETLAFLSKCFDDKSVETREVRVDVISHSQALNYRIIDFLRGVPRRRR